MYVLHSWLNKLIELIDWTAQHMSAVLASLSQRVDDLFVDVWKTWRQVNQLKISRESRQRIEKDWGPVFPQQINLPLI